MSDVNLHKPCVCRRYYTTYRLTVQTNRVNFMLPSRVPAMPNSLKDVNEDESIAITLEGLDVDSDVLTYDISRNPLKGNVVLSSTDGTATCIPFPDFNGSDKFMFTVSDGQSR